ncbi:MAG TPA: Ig-like domain-containing protein [Solirubrobacteraceae bacterium]|nr:Ig-like domain-containing protein [Solirubrobacteraceae bacterium]
MQVLRRCTTLAVLVAALAFAASPALAAPATVNLRIEGKTSTIFEGPVTTDAKTLTKDASGPHACDGTNGGANPAPGPTMTTALDDGAIAGGFTWDGTWFSFGDFGIDRIGPDANSSSEFWGYAHNWQSSSVGGCQQQVADGDDVLFGYDYFSKTALLRLTGPATAEANRPVTVTVVDGQSGSPAAGASVGGTVTGPDGQATVTFSSTGVQRLKAERPAALRSNALVVCVHRGDDGTCGTGVPGGSAGPGPAAAGDGATTDTRGAVPAFVGIREGQRFPARRAPRLLRGTVDPGAAGIHRVRFRLRRTSGGRCFFYSAVLERFRRGTCRADWFLYRVGDRRSWEYLLPSRPAPGSYILSVRVMDRWGRESRRTVRFVVLRDPA